MATRRRNGQLSSCEPCRKSKLRCDHKIPICDRCLHRGQAEHCIYHPAPLTQPSQPQAPALKGSRRLKRQHPENQVVFRVNKKPSTATTQSSCLPTSLDTARSFCDQYVAQWTSMKKWPLAPGYLGLTFPGDIFNEDHDNTSMGNQDLGLDQLQHDTGARRTPGELDKIQLGVQVLLQLKKLPWFHEIIKVKNKATAGWFLGPPLTDSLCVSIEKIYDSAVQDSSDTQHALLSLSQEIFMNTSKEIVVEKSMSMPEYMSSIAARWEAIGLLFTVLGAATFHIPDDDPVFTHCNPWNINRAQLRGISTAISEICCQFCNNSGVTSDPLCWLVTQQTVLLTLMVGNSDYRTWQKLGDLSTITYAVGLHQPSVSQEETSPFFLTEIRKRVLACAYAIDKELATTLGRPPRICSRYCHIQLPLDLSYEELIATPGEIEKALENLDANGWNTKGSLTLEVRLRIALLTSFTRENILELSMSHQTDDLLDRVEKMIQDSRQMQQTLPLFLRRSPSETEAEAQSSNIDESRSLTHLEFTYQEFLLYRILLKRLGVKSQGLIDTSYEIISTLLSLIAYRTRSAKSMRDISHDLCYMGLPAAGILITELQLLGTRKQPPSTQPQPQPQPPLNSRSRSEIIQKLSVFVSHLKSFIEPHEAIYEVVQQGTKIICKVLDQVLSVGPDPDSLKPITLTSASATDIDLSENWLGAEGYELNIDESDDLMPWLENLDWGQDPWLHFS